jgi:hypothetical protein
MALRQTREHTETLNRLRRSQNAISSEALAQIEATMSWYRQLPANLRSSLGLVVQKAVAAFTSWFTHQELPIRGTYAVLAEAPPDLTRAVSLRNTLQVVRVIVRILEEKTDEIASPGYENIFREATLRYSREIAFSTAEVYAHAAEMRGAWDARLETLAIDAVLRGDSYTTLRSHLVALGWTTNGPILALVGHADASVTDAKIAQLRRSVRRVAPDSLVGMSGDGILVLLGGGSDLTEAAHSLTDKFGSGPVVIGPVVASIAEARVTTEAALAGLAASVAWPGAPRPINADDLLPERVLAGDESARTTLVSRCLTPLMSSSGPLLETLARYIDNGRSLEAAARTLFVHPNTVRYRLRRVCEITGWDPLDPRESYVLQTALAIGYLDGKLN